MYGFVQLAMLLVYSCVFLTVCAKAFAVRAGSPFDDVYNDVVCASLTCQHSTLGPKGKLRSSPAEKALPRADRITTRTLGSELACWKREEVCCISLEISELQAFGAGSGRNLLDTESIQRLRSIDFCMLE